MHPEDIKAELKKRGYTMSRIARELDVSPDCVRVVVQGTSKSAGVMNKIAHILGRSRDEIWPTKKSAV